MRALGWLIGGEWRQHPGRVMIAVVAIAVGVALGFAIHLINGSAMIAFGQAMNSVNGAADMQVKAASSLGVDERLYPKILEVEGVEDASPVILLKARDSRGNALTLLGLDIIRAAAVTPSLIASPTGDSRAKRLGGGVEDVFATDTLFLSRAALAAGQTKPGDRVAISANGRTKMLTIRGILPAVSGEQRMAMMDIAAAQWLFGKLGTIDRIDIKLAEGADPATVRSRLAKIIPKGGVIADEKSDEQQSDSLSRAYRVNLDMLALVALFTGSFLVYSTQSLSVTRRLQSFALLRTLGLQKRGVTTLVALEGLMTGLIGAVLGLGIGFGLAAGAMRLLSGDLGSGMFGDSPPELHFSPLAGLFFFVLGLLAALGGSIFPALQGARAAPAVALKNAGDALDPRTRTSLLLPLLLLGAGIGAAFLPAIGRLPLFGYASVGLLLAAGITAMPQIARAALAPLARRSRGNFSLDLAVQHLHGAPGAAATALCGIVASTALMIAMAVMVTSFRGAVDDWLGEILSGDLYVRAEPGWGGFDPAAQARLTALTGIKTIKFNRQVPISFAADRPAMTLIARPVASGNDGLVLLGSEMKPTGPQIAVWLSEPAARILGRKTGDEVDLPIGAGGRFFVSGIWRDYSHQQGAIVIDSKDYDRLTGDLVRDEALITLQGDAQTVTVTRDVLTAAPPSLKGRISIAEPATLRRFALQIFDRSFAITYLLEAIAIVVGLAGVAATASAQAGARTREFGMLRHIGVGRRQIIAMLGVEGALLGLVGGVVGVALGAGISQVLIHVINPQSFNWTMSTQFPVGLMLSVVGSLIIASALTAMLAGRQAVSIGAVRAVRADW
jgi:putative ABC transport system permease protein